MHNNPKCYLKMEKIKTLSYKDDKIGKLIEKIIDIFKESINIPFRVYIFGSFATGKATYFSDIDIALETEETLNEKDIIRLRKKLNDIPTLRKIDFIYLNKASTNIRETVKEEGVLIYEFGKQIDRI